MVTDWSRGGGRTIVAEMTARPVVAILTLGCKLNLADSEEIARGLQAVGFATVDHVCEADAFVVNTCSVTHVADAKSRRLVRSVRRLAPGAKVAVTGCFPQSAGEAAALALGADLVAGTRDTGKATLVEFLLAELTLRGAKQTDAATSTQRPTGSAHARAFVKAQEGCNDVCAFCIVPQTRGREESRTVERVVAEVQAAVESGAREVVITGTQLGAWGRDLAEPQKPHELIAGILEQTDVVRLRFSSLQPQDISPELLALWEDPRLMPHFTSPCRAAAKRCFSECAAAIRPASSSLPPSGFAPFRRTPLSRQTLSRVFPGKRTSSSRRRWRSAAKWVSHGCTASRIRNERAPSPHGCRIRSHPRHEKSGCEF